MMKFFFISFSIFITIFLVTILYSRKWILLSSAIPKTNYLLVLGAGINNTGQPSKILEDRLDSTAKYAQKFDPKFIILSGTKNKWGYDEPLSMLNSLLLKDVKQESIQLDRSGFSTFDSFINFKKNYGVQRVVIISQKYHLYRALLISRIIGLRSFGLAADNINFNKVKTGFWYFRELFSIPYNLLKIIRYIIQNHRYHKNHRYN
jgi:SanA protein